MTERGTGRLELDAEALRMGLEQLAIRRLDDYTMLCPNCARPWECNGPHVDAITVLDRLLDRLERAEEALKGGRAQAIEQRDRAEAEAARLLEENERLLKENERLRKLAERAADAYD